VACGQVTFRTAHYTLPATANSTLGRGIRPDYCGEEAMAGGRQFIVAQHPFVGTSHRAARRQAGVLTVAMLEPLTERKISIEGQDLNRSADVTSSAPGWVAQ
jgi:hypothetical protein